MCVCEKEREGETERKSGKKMEHLFPLRYDHVTSCRVCFCEWVRANNCPMISARAITTFGAKSQSRVDIQYKQTFSFFFI